MTCPAAVRRGLRRIAVGTARLAVLVVGVAIPWSRGGAGVDPRRHAGARPRRHQGSRRGAGARARNRGGWRLSSDAAADRGRRRWIDRRRALALRSRGGVAGHRRAAGRADHLRRRRRAARRGRDVRRRCPRRGWPAARRRSWSRHRSACVSRGSSRWPAPTAPAGASAWSSPKPRCPPPPAPTESAAAVEVATPLAPVMLGPSAGLSTDPSAVDLVAPDGTTLGTARVAPADLTAARARWWGRVAALLWAILAVGLGVVDGPAGRLAGPDPRHWSISRADRACCRGARRRVVGGTAWRCRYTARGGARARVPDHHAAGGGVVWLAWSAVGRWRIARRRRPLITRNPIASLLVHALVGAAAGAAVAHYEMLVARVLPLPASEAIRFALTPLTSGRLAVAAGTVVLHAAAAGAILVAFGLTTVLAPVGGARGATPPTCRCRSGRRGWRGDVAPSRMVGVAGGRSAGRAGGDGGVGRLGTRRAAPRHPAGAPARALRGAAAAFAGALSGARPAWPPATAGGHRRHDLAAQIVNQRRDLQLYLRRGARRDRSRRTGIADLVAASAPPADRPVAADAAFHVWSQTSLADAAADLVGRALRPGRARWSAASR